MSVQEEDVSYVFPHRDECNVHIPEKCDSGIKEALDPIQFHWICMLYYNMCVLVRHMLPLKCLMYMEDTLLHLLKGAASWAKNV